MFIKKLKKIVLLFAFLPLVISQNIFAGELKGYIKKDNLIYQFEDFTKIDGNTGVSLKYKADKNEKIRIKYFGPDGDKEIGDLSLERNQIFSFPGDGKFIFFKRFGLHTISVKSLNKVAEEITFSYMPSTKKENIFAFQQKSNRKESKSEQKMQPKVSPTEYALNNYNFKQIPDVTNIELSRASGSEIYKEISGSTVLITGSKSIGSGVVIKKTSDKQGKKVISQILTNYHVIKDQGQIGVIKKPSEMSDSAVRNSEVYSAEVVAVNINYDLALIEIKHNKKSGFFSKDLEPVKLGKAKNLEVAQKTHAIGHPSQKYWTYTQGVISQIRPDFEWQYDDNWKLKADVIQTQTPINPGNSGGPLIDENFKLIGLNSFVFEGEGLNYAVSISTIRKFLAGDFQTLSELKRTNKSFSTSKNKKITSDKKCIFKGNRDVYKGYNTNNLEFGQDDYFETETWDCYNGSAVDTWKVDINQDKKTDQIWVDTDENGQMDMMVEYVFLRGKLHTVVTFFDNTSKTQIVKRGFDFDNDGNVDKWDVS